MTPVTQTIFYEKGAIIGGDCLRAAVASIYDLPLEAVPHFAQFQKNWFTALSLYVDSQGFRIHKVYRPKLAEGYVLAFGKSPRGSFRHAVVWSGGEVAHDPHPDGTGLDGEPDELWDIRSDSRQ
jgi:hypothetical protein